jgi:predicted GNAT family acetyltransferase
MSGPVTEVDAPSDISDAGRVERACMEISDSHESVVGRIGVRRAPPRRGRRTVGAWCFPDHMGPADVTGNSGLDVGPHPEQVIKPGELILMTSGGGVTHWVALPDDTRGGEGAVVAPQRRRRAPQRRHQHPRRTMTTSVRDNTDDHRYEVVVDDRVAGFADYDLEGDRITFTHTEVAEEYSGQGLAEQLVSHALDDAERRDLGVVPLCSYVARTISGEADRYLKLVPEDVRKELDLGAS